MAKFSKGDKVESVKTGAKGVVDEVYGDEKYAVLFDGATNPDRVEGFQIKAAPVRSTNSVVQNAIDARRARNAGIWSSTKEAEDRSDIFVRAALSRVNGRFEGIDNEAGTLRDVIKLLASAEQTPKIKKNTDKLKSILSRVEKASALIKGI